MFTLSRLFLCVHAAPRVSYCNAVFVYAPLTVTVQSSLDSNLGSSFEDQKRSVRSTCTPEWQSGNIDIGNTKLERNINFWTQTFTLLAYMTRLSVLPALKFVPAQFQISRQDIINLGKMANPKPNLITTCYEGKYGDREFVFSCRGRPFSFPNTSLYND